MSDSGIVASSSRMGWQRVVLFVVAGIICCALAATSVWILNNRDGGPSKIGMLGVILGAAAVFVPTVCFAFFAPFDRAVRMLTGILVRREYHLSERNLASDVRLVEHQPKRRAARSAIGDALRLVRLRDCGSQKNTQAGYRETRGRDPQNGGERRVHQG